jgi:hypothetical protein
LKQQDAHLKKDLQYLVEECQHHGRHADKRLDKVDAFIDSHLQEKKEPQECLKVVHAWRKYIRGLRRKRTGREHYDEYSQKLKDGPPPGWELLQEHPLLAWPLFISFSSSLLPLPGGLHMHIHALYFLAGCTRTLPFLVTFPLIDFLLTCTIFAHWISSSPSYALSTLTGTHPIIS